VLETVGFGAGAELAGGAGAGAELGGASVGDGVALCGPDPEAGELCELDEPEELDELELGAAGAGCPARAVGWTPAAAPRAFLWCRGGAEEVGVAAAGADVDGCVLEAAAAWPVFWAAAVRANKVAKPTAVIALS
jgi:hypothetical protein